LETTAAAACSTGICQKDSPCAHSRIRLRLTQSDLQDKGKGEDPHRGRVLRPRYVPT